MNCKIFYSLYIGISIILFYTPILSYSIVTQEHKNAAQRVREILAKYAEIELLVQLGEYKKGADPEADFALSHIDKINAFLRQGLSEKSTFDETIKALEQVIA